MHKMACFLWRMEEEGIAKALIAAEINGLGIRTKRSGRRVNKTIPQ